MKKNNKKTLILLSMWLSFVVMNQTLNLSKTYYRITQGVIAAFAVASIVLIIEYLKIRNEKNRT